MASDPRRDADLTPRVQGLERAYDELVRRGRDGDDDGLRVRWMLEELRVSYFAQSLGTTQPISEKRITRELDRLAATD